MVGEGLTPQGRLFAAVVPPPELVVALADQLSPISLPGRPVPPANWHITLRFVGRVDEVTYERWLGALDEISSEACRVSVQGLGAFPQPRRATVLWAGVESAGLGDLAEAVEEAAQRAGIAAEERPFRPHLTLARVRPPADVRSQVEDAAVGTLRWTATEFHVMSAVGSRYAIHESFPLK